MRNAYGLKDSSNSYRAGGWQQWTDFIQLSDQSNKEIETLEEAKEVIQAEKHENPLREFKHTKLKDGFYRIYSRLK